MASKWQLGAPRCPECQAVLTYDLEHDRWDCATHGPIWAGLALAVSRQFAPATVQPDEKRAPMGGQAMTWHQALQDHVERRGLKRLAFWIFKQRVRWYAQRGVVTSARVTTDDG